MAGLTRRSTRTKATTVDDNDELNNNVQQQEQEQIYNESAPLLNQQDIDDDEVDKYEKYAAAARESSYVSITTDKTFWLVFFVLILFGFGTRFYDISKADRVIWDEAHFGKFASHYIRGTFYFDVHPPLGKILLGISGLFAGYNGTFPFESGATYPTELNYTFMRLFCAFFGAVTVPVAYLTALELGLSRKGAFFAALLTLCDTALLVISRFILLDSLLICFTVTTVYCLARFNNMQKSEPFSPDWWLWLGLTGISLGCVASVKWVGLFAIALVGLYTIEQLWEMLGDRDMAIFEKPYTYIHHWIARIICLIIFPVGVYMMSFKLHFLILNHSGNGDAHMSSLFQANLMGNDFDKAPLHLGFGSIVSLKSNARAGGLLHSHVQRYPTGSEQQQVTTYHHKDDNNDWIVQRPWGVDPVNMSDPNVELIKDGDIIRLVHRITTRNLHSHNVKAPVTTKENEVSCYGNATLGDIHDHWQVEIVDDLIESGKPSLVRTLSTRFRLRHVATKCLLRGHSVTLPQWGFKQGEVVCQKGNHTDDSDNYWNVEKHVNPHLPKMGKQDLRSPFWNDFVNLNVAMWQSNNALTPDPDKEKDALTSEFWEWPFMQVGMRMCSWGEKDVKFYLVGHPIVWLGGIFSIIGLVLLSAIYYVRRHRGIMSDWGNKEEWGWFLYVTKVTVLGWVLHYFPFALMGRVTYLHHYFPALYFAILAFAFFFDHIATRFAQPRLTTILYVVMYIAVTGVFIYFSPLSFGFTGPAKDMTGRRWNPKWNLHD